MKILILGGTQFVGRALIDECLARGHEVTIFNRGQTASDIYPQTEKLKGNRDPNISPGLEALKGRTWDACIDTCGYFPRVVKASAEVLKESVPFYTFISTISVYGEPKDFDVKEDESDLATVEDETIEEITRYTYGGLKVLCEKEITNIYGKQCLIIRPGYIFGPHDHTDRYPYWVRRVAEGGEILSAGSPDQPFQYTDVRDLAQFTVAHTEKKTNDVFNICGPQGGLSWGDLLEETRKGVGSPECSFTWASADFANEKELIGRGLPLYTPEGENLLNVVNVSKAYNNGYTFRPTHETARDTLEWDRSRPKDTVHAMGITREKEAELLKEWHARG